MLTGLKVESFKQIWHNLCIRNSAGLIWSFNTIAYAKQLSIVNRYMENFKPVINQENYKCYGGINSFN